MKYSFEKRDFSRVPPEMRAADRWVCWTEDKTPIDVRTGWCAKADNPTTWASFTEAVQYVGTNVTYYEKGTGKKITRQAVGIGFELGDGWVGCDLDGGDAHKAAQVSPDLLAEFAALGTYTEYSKSGEGYHIIGRDSSTEKLDGNVNEEKTVEIYRSGRYFAITGNIYGDLDRIADITEPVRVLHEKYIGAPRRAAAAAKEARKRQFERAVWHDEVELSGADQREFLRLNIDDMLAAIPADDQMTWGLIAQALRAEGYSFDVFDAWSRKSPKYGGTERAWNRANKIGVNGSYIVSQAKRYGWKPQHLTGEYAAKKKAHEDSFALILKSFEEWDGGKKAKTEKEEEAKAEKEEKKDLSTVGMLSPVSDRLDEFFDKIQTHAYEPIRTGTKAFDDLIGGGVLPDSLVFLLAAPGAGKTALTQQVFDSMAANGHDVLYFNLEMSTEQLLARSLSRLAFSNDYLMTAGDILAGYKWSDRQREIVAETLAAYREKIAPHMTYVTAQDTPCDRRSIIDLIKKTAEERTKDGKAAPIVVIDYLHLITGVEREDVQETLKTLIFELKSYATKYHTFVYAISATNRSSNSSGSIDMNSARDSSAVEYGADYSLALNYWDVYKNPTNVRNSDAMEKILQNTPRRMVLQCVKTRMSGAGARQGFDFFSGYSTFRAHDYAPDDYIGSSHDDGYEPQDLSKLPPEMKHRRSLTDKEKQAGADVKALRASRRK